MSKSSFYFTYTAWMCWTKSAVCGFPYGIPVKPPGPPYERHYVQKKVQSFKMTPYCCRHCQIFCSCICWLSINCPMILTNCSVVPSRFLLIVPSISELLPGSQQSLLNGCQNLLAFLAFRFSVDFIRACVCLESPKSCDKNVLLFFFLIPPLPPNIVALLKDRW